MSSAPANSTPCLGFLTAVENPDLGIAGGYLLLNAAGRPLEFHCTAPVKPTRTQEILYGPTLKPFLLGEQIGQTLLSKSKLTPVVVCTDREEMLAAGEANRLPVMLVPPPGDTFSDDAWPREADHLDPREPFARI